MPAPVAVAEAFGDDPDEPVFAGEEDLVATATVGRRREFVTARRCAREALATLGFAPVAIRTGPRREPLWPAGVVGAITHCEGYRAAAVARADAIHGLGIDAEPHKTLPPGVRDMVVAEGDDELLGELAARRPEVHWDRVLFSAKESIYKAWFPLTGRWLGFEEASLSIDPDAGTFGAHLHVESELEIHGRFAIKDGLIATVVITSR
ncbi:4'-phosphopantetheinyl transferase superfamily protein [Actinoplanes sp. TBRC 11911]|nr:4'-phosphopantetheinyl transferase superfamily protein [Actinoplanes sp. TBRC 11911]